MRVLIVSDTHGKTDGLERILETVGEIDAFVHVGDLEGSEHFIDAVVECPKYMVRGNNDFFSDLPKEIECTLGDYKVFITHGHCYYVSLDTAHIKAEGRARGVDIVMFGHTHRPYLDQSGDLITLNPGSVSYPRQEGRRGSYLIMDIDENGKLHFQQEFL